MKISLHNFRTFVNKTVVLDDALCLISGPSGVGKTSIFMGIMFALTGEGKKVTMFGKKSCKVELVIKGLHITRTKGPCRLLVVKEGVCYEDGEAQAVIDSTLPHAHLGYVPQRLHKSFIYMSFVPIC